MCLLGMASLAGGKQVQRLKLMPVSAAAAAVPAQAERAAVALSWSAAGNQRTIMFQRPVQSISICSLYWSINFQRFQALSRFYPAMVLTRCAADDLQQTMFGNTLRSPEMPQLAHLQS